MKKIICALFVLSITTFGANAEFSCGPGYTLEKHKDIDNIPAMECQKLWCMDLETGKSMGNGNSPAAGYRATNAPMQLCDAENNCIECFGERKWCGGEATGTWMPTIGVYTRNGDDNTTYKSYQKGGCFAWRLDKPNCKNGETAVLLDGKWHCATSTGTDVGSRASSVRRTGAIRRRI